METDSTQMVDAVRTNSRDLSPSCMLFKAIRDLFLDTFTNSSLVYDPCYCNSAALAVAQFARSWDPGDLHVWTDSFPNCVNVAVARDSAELLVIRNTYKAVEPVLIKLKKVSEWDRCFFVLLKKEYYSRLSPYPK